MGRIRTELKIIGCTLTCLLLVATCVHWAMAYTAALGYSVTNFATGFGASFAGPIGIAPDALGNLYVGDFVTGTLYKFGPAGGVASAATQLASFPSGHLPHGMSFGKDGNLYLNLFDLGEVVQLDPTTGAIVRTVAVGIPFASALASDPLSGDLFVDQSGDGSNIYRVSPTSGAVTLYAVVPLADGLAFGPDGTLYAAAAGLGGVVAISGTNSPPPTPGTWRFIVPVPFIDGMAVSAVPNTPFLYGNRNDGIITKIDLTTNPPTLTNIVTGGSRGDFAAVGSDGCLYATQTASVLKVTNADGTCLPPPLGPLFPSGPPTVVGASFVIGNLNAVPGNTVNFWGAQWASLNSLSGGVAPDDFKGFAVSAPQSCGGAWTSDPGNSSSPPATVPSYMAVIASSSVTDSGSVITGDVSKIVIVTSNPGYGPAVGHAGTGTVVAVLCGH